MTRPFSNASSVPFALYAGAMLLSLCPQAFATALASGQEADFSKPASVDSETLKSTKIAEQKSIEIFGRVEEIIKERMQTLNADQASGETEPFAKKFEELQTLFAEQQLISNEALDSAAVQESLGETAYQFFVYKEATSGRKSAVVRDSKVKITPAWKLKDVATIAFERSVKIDDSQSRPYDRLARLRLAENGLHDDSLFIKYLLKSLENDPKETQSVSLLVFAISQTAVLSEPDSYREISRALKKLEGNARRKMKIAIVDVTNQLNFAKNSSEQIAAAGYESPSVQQTIVRLSRAEEVIQAAIDEP